jgi:hypothetical protein
MKTKFDVTFDTTMEELRCMGWNSLSNTRKELPELVDSFDVLKIWQTDFDDYLRLGSLNQLIHHSNPDDPPDVVASFEQGSLAIEHTEIEPSHVKQGEAINRRERGLKGHCAMPLSGTYTSTDIKEIMWGWADRRGWEEVSAHFEARYKLITSAIETKLCKHPSGGLLVMKGNLGEFSTDIENELAVIEKAFGKAKTFPGISRWITVIHSRRSPQEVFSVLWIPELGYKCISTKQE